MDMYLPALPELAADLETNETLAQLTMVACMLGLGIGQFVFGPLSDRWGRRVPIVIGVAVFTVFSMLCAFAPNIWTLLLFRFVQGIGGSAGQVVARACVRDMYEGRAMVRMFSLLMLVSGAAPILAPIVGGGLTLVTDWRGIFFTLAGLGALLVCVALFGVRETLPPERRSSGGLGEIFGSFGVVVRDRVFVTMAIVLGFSSAAFFAYLTMSSFVFQQEFALSPTGFSIVFAVNSVAIIAGAQVNGLLARRFLPVRLLRVALIGSFVVTAALLISALLSAPFLVIGGLLTVVLFFQGWIMPNTTALALEHHGTHAGSASALLGTIQFLVGPVVGPMVSLIAVTSLTLGATMVSGIGCALLALLLLLPRRRREEHA